MATTRQTASLDAESKAMLYEGLNLSQLGVAFRMDHRVLVEKLHGVDPSGWRGKAAIYRINEVAPYLVKPIYDIEAYIKRMNHNELPKHLTKEYWAGLRSRQEYELKAGQLWPTSQVVEKVGEIFKLVAMSARLATDNIERTTDLTDKQRDAINGIMRGMLEDLQRKIAENFKEPESDGNQASSDDL
jgi:hypothetical protein